MKDNIINYFMSRISKDTTYDDIKLQEIKYGLYAIYSIVTKTFVILILSLIFNIFDKFIIFFTFYIILRSIGYGAHAKSSFLCWILSITLILGMPYIFSLINISKIIKIIIWIICFINFLIFCPADTEKRPMISVKRKLKFKCAILIISVIYLILIINIDSISNCVLASLILEAFLTNPIGYIFMGQKIRFRLNDINLSKIRMEV